MRTAKDKDIESWESEGGAVRALPGPSSISGGSINQLEWAERIKRQVNDEFDRVARAFRSAADRQSDARRAETEAILAILEDKRAEVMSGDQAGYFIREWQEIADQVRQLIFHDPRYQAIKRARPPERR